MSTYVLRTTDQTIICFNARDNGEARRLADSATRSAGMTVLSVRRYDGAYGRPLPF